jgi:hypothetical protein
MQAPNREQIYTALETLAREYDLDYVECPLRYASGEYVFPKLIARNIQPQDKVLMLGAGVHGNEVAGPATLVIYGSEIVERAHSRGIKIILYPLRNPSAFGTPGKRYNIDETDDAVPVGNNDFVRYELPDGRIVDDLRDSNVFKSWGWASERRYNVALPPETRLMHTLLRGDPLMQVRAAIDLHQDYITPEAFPLAYHYAFGDVSSYRSIIQELEKIIPIARNQLIGAGYAGMTESGQFTRNAASQAIRTDENGFLVRHDGSWTDLIWRIGESQARRVHCITSETTGATPLDLACRVNLIWIFGIVDLVAAVS